MACDRNDCTPGDATADISAPPSPEAAKSSGAHFWRNVLLFYTSDSLAAVATAVVSVQTVVAVLLQQAGFANVILGLSMATSTIGVCLTQVPAAFWASRARHKGRWLTWLRVAESLPRLVAVVGAFMLAPSRPWATAFLLFMPLFAGSLLLGANRPVRAELDGRLVPHTRRGRYYGAMMVAQVGLGMLGAALARSLLAQIPGRGGYAACFAAAAAFGIASAIPFSFLPEPENGDSKKQGRFLDYFHGLTSLIGADRNYRNFLWGRALVGIGHMAQGFFAVYALERFHLPAKTAPLFTIPALVGQAMGSFLWGYVGDKKGHRLVQLAMCVQSGLAPLLALVAPNAWVFALVFWMNGMAYASDFVSTNNFLLESAPDHDMMGYVSFANSLIAPTFALSSILGGAIADLTSFRLLFFLSVLIWVGGFWVMAARVRDPRAMKRPAA